MRKVWVGLTESSPLLIWTFFGVLRIWKVLLSLIDMGYPNVPLLGIRGGITYSPCLALRQFGRARRDGPHELLLTDIAFNYKEDVDEHH